MSMARTRTVSLFDLTSVVESQVRRTAEQAKVRRAVGKAKVPYSEGVRLRDVLIRTLAEAGTPVCVIAEAVGRSERTVYERLELLGLDTPRAKAGRNARR